MKRIEQAFSARADIYQAKIKRFGIRKTPKKPLLLTMDGNRGSGKTLQLELLGSKMKERDITFHHLEMIETSKAGVVSDMLHLVQQHLSSGYENIISSLIHKIYVLKMYQRDPLYYQRDGFVFDCWFWGVLIEYFMIHGHDTVMLDIFRALLNANDGYEPTISFYLSSTIEEQRNRLYVRTEKLHNRNPVESIVNRQYQYTKEEKRQEQKTREIVKWLADEVDYFYVIDGMRDLHVIAYEVESIMKQRGLM